MKQVIYVDNAATTMLDSDAYKAMSEILQNEYGNPSQPYSFSRAAKKLLTDARETIAQCINADPDEIYFTSGGTESDNWAIKGTTFADKGKRAIITSQIEHHAVLRPCQFMESQGYPVVYLPVRYDGTVAESELEDCIADTTNLVSIMLVNNETGIIQPVKNLATITHAHGALFHTDAVQAVGHIPVDVKDLGVDLLSASAHKFNGPKGIGFLYVKKGTLIVPFMHGGAQEKESRAGTENIAEIVGMAIALKSNIKSLDTNLLHLTKLEEAFFLQLRINGFLEGSDFIRVGVNNIHVPGFISISFLNNDGERLLHRLDLMGIAVSTGAACDSVHTQASHVLKAIGISHEYITGTIRITFGKNNTVEEAKKIADALYRIIK